MEQRLIDEVLGARQQTLGAVPPPLAEGRLVPRARIDALCDSGSFVEYGVLAQGSPDRSDTPADGLVAGIARIDGQPVAVCSYDAAIEGGTQSTVNQAKIERLIFMANEHAWPFICFADGEGERQRAGGHVQWIGGSGRIGLFDGLCEHSGLAPSIAVISGTSLDGNAAIAMLSDFVIATAGSTVGTREDGVVPVEEHERLGDVDCVVQDEPAAIETVRRLLDLLLRDRDGGEAPATASAIADFVPENRRRAYDMRRVIDALADADSLLELRPNWGTSMLTYLGRLHGRTVGIFANQPRSKLAGAIDADAADKMCRFIEICDAYNIPLVSLIDSPGFHIGPDAERGGIARHHVRTLSALEHRDVPLYCVQVRKAYGLGPLVMRGSWGHLPPELRLAWPTVETGGMSLEGAAYLARRKEILAAATPEEARAIRDDYAETLRARESGVRAGQNFSFDDIVHPAETRDRIGALLQFGARQRRTTKKTYLDTI